MEVSSGCRTTPTALPQANMEAPRTPLEDLVPFTGSAFWELPGSSEGGEKKQKAGPPKERQSPQRATLTHCPDTFPKSCGS